MAKTVKTPPMPVGDEWAEGMPAWWLQRVDKEQKLTAEEIARFYFVQPKAPRPGVA